MAGKNRILRKIENQNNPIIQPLITLFERLNELNGLLFHLNDHLKNYRKSVVYLADNSKWDYSKILAGNALGIRDLSEFPDDGWARCYPISSFWTEGGEYFKIADDLIIRESAWTISQAYEAFETLIKEITATFLIKNNNNQQYRKEFLGSVAKLKRNPKKSLNPESTENWRTLISKYYQNNELFILLRKITPELEKLEKRNNRAIDLTIWYSIITEVRHGITHFNRLIKKQKIGNWSQYKCSILSDQFSGVFTNQGYMLNPTIKNAEQVLTFFAEYGYIILKCLSKLENYDLNNILTDSISN